MSDALVRRIHAAADRRDAQVQGSTSDLTPDPKNANRGTERGRGMLERSISELGLGRGISTDKHGTVIAGNKTLETAVALGLVKTQIVKTRGDVLVVTQREDLDLSDPQDTKARQLAYADNRVAQVDLEWDTAVVADDIEQGVPLDAFWSESELETMLKADAHRDHVMLLDQAVQLRPEREYVVVMCEPGEAGAAEFERLKTALGLKIVRRGGYRRGAPLDLKVGTQRVVTAADLLGRLESRTREDR